MGTLCLVPCLGIPFSQEGNVKNYELKLETWKDNVEDKVLQSAF